MTDKLLVDVLYLFCNAFRIYTIFIFISLFHKRESPSRLVETLSYVTYFLINSSIYLICENPLLNLINNVGIIFLLTLFFKLQFKTCVLATVVIFSISTLVETIVVAAFFRFNYTTFKSLGALIISGLIIFAIVVCIKIFANIKEYGEVSIFHCFIISSISAISIFITLVLTFSDLRSSHNLIVVSMILLLIMNFMVIYLYDSIRDRSKQIKVKEFLQQQNNLYIKQYETIYNSQENIRILRHDIKGHMSAVQIMLENNKQNQAIKYIQNIYQTLDSVIGTVNTGNVAIDSVLNCKIQEAAVIGISFKLRLKVPTQLNISPFDLSAILVNLLDNAINAVKILEQAEGRDIMVSISLERGVLYINIANPFNGYVIYQGDQIKTTHQDSENHGYGLLSIKNSLEKYNGTIEIKQKNCMFTVNALLYDIFPNFKQA